MGFRVLMLTTISVRLFAQQSPFFPERIGMLGVKRSPATWKSPESVFQDLRSGDDAIRLAAIHLLGANEGLYGKGEPRASDLRYVIVGRDALNVAVLTVESQSNEYAAVAVLTAGSWKRVAVFECWCKYETPLKDFVHVTESYDDGPELQIIARASGGGTGLYEQTEARFGLRNGALKDVLSFVRRRRSCNAGECDYERRWFDGNQLIEGSRPSLKFRTDDASTFREQLLGWEVDDSSVRSFTCTPYKWDAASFKYVRSGTAHPCKYEPPR
jgi:hypothetical protein